MPLDYVHVKKKCSQSSRVYCAPNQLNTLCAVGLCSREEKMFTEQSGIVCAVGLCSREEKMFTEQSDILGPRGS